MAGQPQNEFALLPPAPRRSLEDSVGWHFHGLVVKKMYLWVTGPNAIKHWVTSYEFSSKVFAFNNNLTQLWTAPVPANGVQPQNVWEGFSMDMQQPTGANHERYNSAIESGPNVHGSLVVSARPNQRLYSAHAGLVIPIIFVNPVNVAMLISVVSDPRMHTYDFHTNSSGCLCWQMVLLHKFLELRWITNPQLYSVKSHVKHLSQRVPGITYPPQVGRFPYGLPLASQPTFP